MTATLRYIVMPLAWPGIFSALVLLFVCRSGKLATALFLYTSNTIIFSVAMFDLLVARFHEHGRRHGAGTAAILLVFVARAKPLDVLQSISR